MIKLKSLLEKLFETDIYTKIIKYKLLNLKNEECNFKFLLFAFSFVALRNISHSRIVQTGNQQVILFIF